MAYNFKNIPDLPEAPAANSTDLIEIYQDGKNKKIEKQSLLSGEYVTNDILWKLFKGGKNYFLNSHVVIAAAPSGKNNIPVYSLTSCPNNGTTTELIREVSNSAPVIFGAYIFNDDLQSSMMTLSNDLQGAYINAGIWVDKTLCMVDDNNYSTEIIKRISIITDNEMDTFSSVAYSPYVQIITLSPTAQNKFSRECANIDPLLASYFMTPNGMYQITTWIDDYHVKISVPPYYTSETNQPYKIWKNKFGITTGAIKNTELKELTSLSDMQVGITLNTTDKIGVIVFAKTDAPKIVAALMDYNSSTTYSHIETPTIHNIKSIFIQPSNTTTFENMEVVTVATSGDTKTFNIYIPYDSRKIVDAKLIYFTALSIENQEMILTVNYTSSPNGTIVQNTATTGAQRYTHTAQILNKISFNSLLSNAKYGTSGTLTVTNNSETCNIYVRGIEILYK